MRFGNSFSRMEGKKRPPPKDDCSEELQKRIKLQVFSAACFKPTSGKVCPYKVRYLFVFQILFNRV